LHDLKYHKIALLFGIALIWININAAQADVIRKHKVTSQFLGVSETQSTEYYSSDRSCNETTTQWTEGMMKTMSGGKPISNIGITRLDKELIWQLQPDKKNYTEMTFAEFREMLSEGMKKMQEARGQADSVMNGEDQYTWTTSVASDPNSKKIDGYSCRNAKVIAQGISKRNPEEKVWITMDAWNSTELPGSDELKTYQERYMKAMNLNESAFTPGMMNAMAGFGKQMEKLIEEMRKAPGEPVQMTVEVKNRQIAVPTVETPNVGDAAAQEMLKKLPFGLGKPKKEEKKAPPPPSENGEIKYEERVTIQITTNLVEASTSSIPAAKFEIPEGFKLVKSKDHGMK
jgi:hypothetical protein